MISTITSNFISLIPTIIYKYVDTGNPLINSFVILLIITIVTNVFNLKNIDLYFLSLYFKLKLIILRDKSDGINLSSDFINSFVYERYNCLEPRTRSWFDMNDNSMSLKNYYNCAHVNLKYKSSIEQQINDFDLSKIYYNINSEITIDNYGHELKDECLEVLILPVFYKNNMTLFYIRGNVKNKSYGGSFYGISSDILFSEYINLYYKELEKKYLIINKNNDILRCNILYGNNCNQTLCSKNILKNITFDTILLNDKKEILPLLDNFKNGNLYDKMMHNNLGFIIYGPPGTGKTSFISCIANYLNKNVVVINLNLISNGKEFINLMDKYKDDIIVFEEFDFSIIKLMNKNKEDQNKEDQNKEKYTF